MEGCLVDLREKIVEARIREALLKAIGAALSTVTARKVGRNFEHCRYRLLSRR
jgi:hypothetical protein